MTKTAATRPQSSSQNEKDYEPSHSLSSVVVVLASSLSQPSTSIGECDSMNQDERSMLDRNEDISFAEADYCREVSLEAVEEEYTTTRELRGRSEGFSSRWRRCIGFQRRDMDECKQST